MSSGNPFGLSEISHFGTFQRVGGKAGGFITKKFFHPSSFRNQEKLWKAQTADERERRKQDELEKRREEERQVEALRKQMYLAGQGRAGDSISSSVADGAAGEKVGSAEKAEQKACFDEFTRRKLMLKQERREREAREAAHGASADESAGHVADAGAMNRQQRPAVQSSYLEDVYILGHAAVWGSWYEVDAEKWGFACCKVTDRALECPEAPEASAAEARGRQRRAEASGPSAGAAATEAAASSRDGKRRREEEGRSSAGSSGEARQEGSADRAGREPLIDLRMVEAAEQRREKRQRAEDARHAQERSSDYLANLLSDPAGGA